MIKDNQYKFFKFCLETGDLKSQRQKEYFTRAIEEYEIENEINQENQDVDTNWWDYIEIIISGLIIGATVNYMF
jgi:hypothetical protein